MDLGFGIWDFRFWIIFVRSNLKSQIFFPVPSPQSPVTSPQSPVTSPQSPT
ncbi:hypothetical protein PN497_12630 [Sphaerospermopsis kisseleviana CS-549]|uniref:Uncharacterized protein n=1 Tax=Sphaerospermopsis kisseleviana CS-549 TaxID=3021783 RepID=A0ABT4ZS13_9CYAN|nr:hypothetical protein [Sphaerospermopsis kisseleviana]MDB9442199.1 hypothetical protein [Sphaerospermopsis kisseleviana CS-549]